MRLSRKVLVLWNIRSFSLLMLIYPLQDYANLGTFWNLIITSSVFLSLFLIFYLRYKYTYIEATPSCLTLYKGIIIKRKLILKYRHIVAVNRIYTLLSKNFGLCNLLLYCEGAVFILPPLDTHLITQIEENITNEVRKNEK